MRDASVRISGSIAKDAAADARSQGGLAAIVAPTIKARRDRYPVVEMGGSKRLPRSGDGWRRKRSSRAQSVGDVIFGSEFGGGARKTTRQFRPHRGTIGYFFYPAVRSGQDEALEQWLDALQSALDRI
jgi:hypothetical protein